MKRSSFWIHCAVHDTPASYVAIGFIILVALLLRLMYIPFALRHDPYLVRDPLFGDARSYDAIALNLCRGNGFAEEAGKPTSWRAPLYPAFLALVYCTVGHSLLTVRIIQALMGATIAFLVFLIARRFYGLRCALIAASIMALHPIVIYFGVWIITETLFVLVLCVVFLMAIRASDRPTVPALLGLGLLQGVAALARPQAILYWPVLPAWALAIRRRQSLRRAIGAWLIVVLVSLATVLPWTIRNYFVHGGLVLIDTHGGWTLYGSYGTGNQGGFVPKWVAAAKGLTEYQQDILYYQLAFQWINDHPVRAAQLVPAKIGRLLSPIAAVDKEYPLPWGDVMKLLYGIFLLIALAGMILSASQWRDSSLLYANVSITMLTAVIFYGCTRFSLPMQPALAVFSAIPIAALTRKCVTTV